MRLTPLPWKVGDTWKTERDSELRVSVEFWKESGRIGTSETRKREILKANVEVLGLVGAHPGKVEVRYDRYQFLEPRSAEAKGEEVALEGKTFIVDATNSPSTVSTAKGEAVSEAVSERVRGHFASLGEEDPIVRNLGTRPIEVGRRFSLRQNLFRALLGSSAGEYKGGQVTITETPSVGGQPAARIEWTADLDTPEENGVTMSWHIKGKTLVLLRPARVVENLIQSPLDASGQTKHQGAWVRIEGAGAMHDDRRNDFGD